MGSHAGGPPEATSPKVFLNLRRTYEHGNLDLPLCAASTIFPLYFQLPYLLPEETCFQQAGSSAVEEDTSQATWINCSAVGLQWVSIGLCKKERMTRKRFQINQTILFWRTLLHSLCIETCMYSNSSQAPFPGHQKAEILLVCKHFYSSSFLI